MPEQTKSNSVEMNLADPRRQVKQKMATRKRGDTSPILTLIVVANPVALGLCTRFLASPGRGRTQRAQPRRTTATAEGMGEENSRAIAFALPLLIGPILCDWARPKS
jgi:hypothetical protein